MSEDKKVTNISEAPSAQFTSHVEQAAKIVNPEPQESTLQSAERSRPPRLTARGRKVLAGLALAGAVFVGHQIAPDGNEEVKPAPTSLLADFQKTGNVPKGYTAVEFNNVQPGDTASAESYELGSGENRQDLQDSIEAQTDTQGAPGIQSGEVAVVETSQLNLDEARDQIIPNQG